MTRRMTQSEALDFIETAFNVGPDTITSGLVDAFVAGIDADQARTDLESYLAMVPAEIDPASINISPDRLDDNDMSCVHIVIRTGDGS